MFDTLSDRLGGVFDRLRGRGALTEADVRSAMREVRVALLEADVALPVARDFVDKVTEKAVGQEVLRSVTPGQMVVKIVHDALVETLGAETAELDLGVTPPAVIMMVGLQGSGKTTTTAKLAKRLTERERKKVLMASLDVARPAAQEQLAVLGARRTSRRCRSSPGQQPVDIARRALQSAKLQGYDVVLLDTAGRLHVDEQLMDEMKAVAAASQPDRNPARRRCADRPGRGQRRQELCRRGRSDRRDPHPDGRRCARRCGALDARGHRQADQVRRRRRGARQARGLPPGPRRRPHPRHGRRRQPGRARRRDDPGRRGREARGQDGQGQVRPRRPARPSFSRCSAWAASARSPA